MSARHTSSIGTHVRTSAPGVKLTMPDLPPDPQSTPAVGGAPCRGVAPPTPTGTPDIQGLSTANATVSAAAPVVVQTAAAGGNLRELSSKHLKATKSTPLSSTCVSTRHDAHEQPATLIMMPSSSEMTAHPTRSAPGSKTDEKMSPQRPRSAAPPRPVWSAATARTTGAALSEGA